MCRRLICAAVLWGLCLSGTVVGQEFRTIDGSGNNESNTAWGASGSMLLRLADEAYGDGESTPAGADRPSAREISNALCDQPGSSTNGIYASDMLWLWGQFLDHDISLSLTHDSSEVDEEFAIDVPMGDEWFDPFSTGAVSISLMRSVFEDDEGVRQQLNDITAFIDASNVYGSDDVRAEALRLLDDSGKLATSEGDLLPYNVDGLPNAETSPVSADFFLAGDVRANENAALTALHTLFVREHNRLCDEISESDEDLTGDEIYDRARRIVGALMQVITYQEFLPLLLGEGALADYDGYDDEVNPGIANEFSTACYRFGHSMLSPELFRYEDSGGIKIEGHLPLRDGFFSPTRVSEEGGIEPLLRGIGAHHAQAIDCQVIDDVRNFLFGPPGAGGFDLASLNIQRGRDHGIANYNDLREALGLDRVEEFSDITAASDLSDALEDIYESVDDVDAWIGALAEDHVDGAMVGETCYEVFVDQFTRLRDGDRFWYQNDFSASEIDDLEATTLADVIARNTEIDNGPEDVFVVPQFRRGDINQDGDVATLADTIVLLDWMFLGSGQLLCLQTADFGDDGRTDLADPIGMLRYTYLSGVPPEAPFADCGHDETSDGLGCFNYTACD